MVYISKFHNTTKDEFHMASYTRERCLLPDLLLKAGLEQAELARLTEIHPRLISHYCNNTKRMNVDHEYTIWITLRNYLPQLQMNELHKWKLRNR